MLESTDMQDSSLSHNEFALCLRSLLRPSSALSPCEFTTCMRALRPSSVPSCLRSLPRPSLALYPSEFESLYMRALTPTHVPAGFRQSYLWQQEGTAENMSGEPSYGPGWLSRLSKGGQGGVETLAISDRRCVSLRSLTMKPWDST